MLIFFINKADFLLPLQMYTRMCITFCYHPFICVCLCAIVCIYGAHYIRIGYLVPFWLRATGGASRTSFTDSWLRICKWSFIWIIYWNFEVNFISYYLSCFSADFFMALKVIATFVIYLKYWAVFHAPCVIVDCPFCAWIKRDQQ